MIPLAGYYGPGADPETTAVLALVLVVAAWLREQLGRAWIRVREWWHGEDDEPTPPDDHPAPELWLEYQDPDNRMTEAELDRRLEAALDPRQSRALAIAEAFGSVETIAAHSPAEVAERVDGIGDVYAERAVRAARDAVATGEVAPA